MIKFFFIFLFLSINIFAKSYSFYINKYYHSTDSDSSLTYLINAKDTGAPKDTINYLFTEYFLENGDYENALLANLNIKKNEMKNKKFKISILNQRIYIYSLLDLKEEKDKVKKELYNLMKKNNKITISLNTSNSQTKLYFPVTDTITNSSYNGFSYNPNIYYKYNFSNSSIYCNASFNELIKDNIFSKNDYYTTTMDIGYNRFLSKTVFMNLSSGYYNNSYSDTIPNAINLNTGINYFNSNLYSFIKFNYQFSSNEYYQYFDITPYFSLLNIGKINFGHLKINFDFYVMGEFYLSGIHSKKIYTQKIYGAFSDTSTVKSSKYKYITTNNNISDTINVPGTLFEVTDSLANTTTMQYLPYFSIAKSKIDSIKLSYRDYYQKYTLSSAINFNYKKMNFVLNPKYIIKIYPKENLFKYYTPNSATSIDTTLNEYVYNYFENKNKKDFYISDWDNNSLLKDNKYFNDSLDIQKDQMLKYISISGNIFYKDNNWYFGLYGSYLLNINNFSKEDLFLDTEKNSLYISLTIKRFLRW